MNHSVLILSTAILVYLCRLSGFAVNPPADSARLQAFFSFVPVATFSALTVSAFARELGLWEVKLIAFLVTGVYLWRTKQLGYSLLLGLGVFFLLTNR